MRFRFLFAILLVFGPLAAHGQDLRTGIPLDNGGFLAAGECLAWLDEEGEVLRLKTLDRPLTALVSSGKHLYALDSKGRELIKLDSKGSVVTRKALPVLGRLRDLAVDGDILWVVTDAGEIVHGNLTSGWKVLDFNAQYEGYYPLMAFLTIAIGGGSIMVAGVGSDGKPAAFTSARGSVWNERSLDYMDHGAPCTFTAEITDLSHDASQDRFYLMGSGGQLLAIPGCSHCNSLTRYPVDMLYARIPAGSGVLLLGSEGFKKMEP